MKLQLTMILAAVAFAQAETLDVELQRIAQKALVSGDYTAAIKAYKGVVSRAGLQPEDRGPGAARHGRCLPEDR